MVEEELLPHKTFDFEAEAAGAVEVGKELDIGYSYSSELAGEEEGGDSSVAARIVVLVV